MIHAYLVGEGSARKWAHSIDVEAKSFEGWRELNQAPENTEEIDQLAI